MGFKGFARGYLATVVIGFRVVGVRGLLCFRVWALGLIGLIIGD